MNVSKLDSHVESNVFVSTVPIIRPFRKLLPGKKALPLAANAIKVIVWKNTVNVIVLARNVDPNVLVWNVKIILIINSIHQVHQVTEITREAYKKKTSNQTRSDKIVMISKVWAKNPPFLIEIFFHCSNHLRIIIIIKMDKQSFKSKLTIFVQFEQFLL